VNGAGPKRPARYRLIDFVIAGLVPAISIPVAGHRKRRALGMPRSLTSRSGAA